MDTYVIFVPQLLNR